MGLLDALNSDEGLFGLSLLAAGAPRAGGRTSLGEGLLNASQMVAQRRQQAQEQAMRQQMQQAQLAEMQARAQERQAAMLAAQQQAAQQAAVEDAYRKALRTPQQSAMAQNGGPTLAAAAAAETMGPSFDQKALIANLIGPAPMKAAEMLSAKPKTMTLKPGEQVFTEDGKSLFGVPDKAPEAPGAVREYQFAQSQGFRGTFDEWKKGNARAGATNIRVDTAPKAFWQDFGKSASDQLFKERETAQAAAATLESVATIRRAAQGGAYQGSGAELKLGAAKALGALGMPYDSKTVANSEVFNATANQFVLNAIKGLGANPSNADREFIEKTVPRLQTDPAALPALLTFMEQKAGRQVQGFNNKIRQVQRDPSAGGMPFSLEVTPPATGSAGWSITPVPGR
jgi:hypothetical protein